MNANNPNIFGADQCLIARWEQSEAYPCIPYFAIRLIVSAKFVGRFGKRV